MMKKVCIALAVLCLLVTTVMGVLAVSADKVTYGDLNGDGRIRAQEARQVLQASSGSAELTALQIIAADLNGDGRIRAQEARTLLQASSGSATLSW